jgi:predicted MFS family arabinose efflux permease
VNDSRADRSPAAGAPAGAALLALAPVLPHLDRALLASLVEPLRVELWLTDATLGLLAAVVSLLLALAGPAFLALGDRGPRPRLVAAGLGIAALGALLAGLARSFPALLAARGASGIGLAAGATLAAGVLARPWAGGPLLLAVGAAGGYALGAAGLAGLGWRGAFLAAAGAALLGALPWLRLPEPDPGRPRGSFEQLAPERIGLVARRLAASRTWTLTLTAFAALAFAAAALAFWAPAFLTRVRGVPRPMAAGQLAAAVLMAGVVGTALGPAVAARLRSRLAEADRFAAGGLALLAVPLLVAAFVSPHAHEYLPALVAGLALLFAAVRPATAALLAGSGAVDQASAAAVALLAVRLAGEVPAPALVGALSDAGSLVRAVLVVPGAALLAGGLWLAVAYRLERAPARVDPTVTPRAPPRGR